MIDVTKKIIKYKRVKSGVGMEGKTTIDKMIREALREVGLFCFNWRDRVHLEAVRKSQS